MFLYYKLHSLTSIRRSTIYICIHFPPIHGTNYLQQLSIERSSQHRTTLQKCVRRYSREKLVTSTTAMCILLDQFEKLRKK